MTAHVSLAAATIPRLPDGRVLVGVRTLEARSFPGSLAFPGGAVDEGDEQLPRATSGAEHAAVHAAERGCALREMGEETGRWLLCSSAGDPPGAFEQARFAAALAAGAPLLEALRASGLVLDDRRLVPLGRWVTPDFLPTRFDLLQMLVPLAEEPDLVTAPSGELTDVGFRDAREIFAQWRRGEALLLPPIRFVLRALVEGDDETMVARLRAVPGRETPELRDVIAGVAVQPYRTPTLPPATHTNTVLLGAGDYLVVDPATPYADERRRFDALIGVLAREGRRMRAVVLTHHHADHVGDAGRLAGLYRVPVWAHRETAARVDVAVERLLDEGDVLELEGDPVRRFTVLFTPGHAPGHICLFDDDTGVLVAGDMVATAGSILIDPPEGHMGTYLTSMRRLIASGARRVVPAHGPLIADGAARLKEHVEHRLARQRQVLAALPSQPPGATPLELVPGIYGGEVPAAMFPLAARSVLAALELLVEEGAAGAAGDRYFRV